jgi:hypothetical protein
MKIKATARGKALATVAVLASLAVGYGAASASELRAAQATATTTSPSDKATATSKATYAPKGDSLPRCVNDDYNDGTQDFCYSETVKGEYFVIDKHDKIVSINPDAEPRVVTKIKNHTITKTVPNPNGFDGWTHGTYEDGTPYVMSPEGISFSQG